MKSKIILLFTLISLLVINSACYANNEIGKELYALAESCKESGNNEQAITYYKKYCNEMPDDFDAHFNCSNICFNEKKLSY